MRNRSAFSVLLGVAILAAASYLIHARFGLSPDHKTTRDQMETLASAIDKYLEDCGALPANTNDLREDPGIAGWQGPYLKRAILDAWGVAVYYKIVDGEPHVVSSGPDRIRGTKDDLVR